MGFVTYSCLVSILRVLRSQVTIAFWYLQPRHFGAQCNPFHSKPKRGISLSGMVFGSSLRSYKDGWILRTPAINRKMSGCSWTAGGIAAKTFLANAPATFKRGGTRPSPTLSRYFRCSQSTRSSVDRGVRNAPWLLGRDQSLTNRTQAVFTSLKGSPSQQKPH